MHPSDTACGTTLVLQKPRSRTTWLWPDERGPWLFDGYTAAGPVNFCVGKPYPSYPIRRFSVGSVQLLLEGVIYNHPFFSVEKTLQSLLPDGVSPAALQHLTAGWSGEWCLWVQNKDELFMVNDPLGRLPVYHYSTEGHFFAGRHLGTLSEAGLLRPCPKAAASFLWSSYFIGHRTPYQQVFRLPGGSVVQVNLSTGQADIAFGKSLNFDERSTTPLQQTAEELAGLFKQACTYVTQAWPGNINISLSGGQDSRAVAAAFRSGETGISAAQTEKNSPQQLFASSFTMHGAEKDAALAGTIAAHLHIPFTVFPVQELPADEDVLLQNKMGMNYTGMAFIHSFYRQMLQKNGDFLYVTGDGGDKALPYLGERQRHLSLDELVTQLAMRHAMTPVEKVARLTGMAVNDILQLIYEVVRSYPEREMNNRSIHFAIYERAAQSFFEGEDRSRYFFWATTPFYDLDFFKAAMQVPDTYKKHYRLYRPFQNALNRQVADIPDASGHSINTWKFVLRKGVQEAFRSASPAVKNIVRKLGGKSISINQSSLQEQQRLLALLQASPALLQTLNADAIRAFLNNANQEQYLHLRTLILLSQFYKHNLAVTL